MAFSGNTQNVRAQFRAGASAQTTTSQFKIACLAYTTTNYRTPYVVVNTCAANNPIIGVIDTMQSAGSEAVGVIVYGPAKVQVANTGCATFSSGYLVTYDTDTTGQAIVVATGAAYHVLGFAIGEGNTGCYADVFVNPFYRAGAALD